MSLPRHYEPSTFEEHPVDLEYGDCHTDEAGHLLLKEFEGVPSHNILNTVGSEVSARSVACNCRTEKLKKGLDDQAWLDRLVGCTESYMYLMLPKRKERARLGLLERDGWRDLIAEAIDPILHGDILNILPEHARSMSLFSLDPNAPIMTIRSNANLNGDTEEWCRLRKEDLIDVTSDTEVYMKTDSDVPLEEEIGIKRRKKRWRER
ncbi:hypothetical protein BEWA_046020 [Theileria equi strain WA]|uniref:Uncharacterized protein n=1 Tax=Theileria equi strain WA TaxID=1537102 RepID=L1LAD5_THEEQ|nr:hypothetical protein BEWA_046020 [Theileria equi strain WA]EKX72138.1 hypothetical protein BEWA_046020 [Theileria equi strain WA]|eukprot:XP_004831590.1 hypothetical protein BEWA_046020 [Theileria equi strain WA]